MKDILEEIAAYTRERIAGEMVKEPLSSVRHRAEERTGKPPSFYEALSGKEMSYICEVKKASPSKGLIAKNFPYLDIAKEYETAGASAISCLTEPHWFMGKDSYLEEITSEVGIPVLRKDFTVNEYMVYQAAAIGASAVLLICSILDDVQLKAYRQLAEELGLDALVEAHDEAEVERAAGSGARVIGVNNRNLRDFTVNMDNSIRLRGLVRDESVIFVSESGIQTQEDIRRLKENGIAAVLIGETLMRADDKKKMLEQINGGSLIKK